MNTSLVPICIPFVSNYGNYRLYVVNSIDDRMFTKKDAFGFNQYQYHRITIHIHRQCSIGGALFYLEKNELVPCSCTYFKHCWCFYFRFKICIHRNCDFFFITYIIQEKKTNSIYNCLYSSNLPHT